MLKRITLLGILLILAGVVTISWLEIKEKNRQQKIAVYKSKHSKEIDSYMEKYNQWLKFSPLEKDQSPWDPSLLNKDKKPAQLFLEQSERLQADIDSLADGQATIRPFAHIFYGNDWQEKVAEYKKRKELQGTLLLCSYLGTLAGSAVFLYCSSVWAVRLLKQKSTKLQKAKNKKSDIQFSVLGELSLEPDKENETKTDKSQTDSIQNTTSNKKIPKLLRSYAEKNTIVSETIIHDPLAQIRNRTSINNKNNHYMTEKSSERTKQNSDKEHLPLNNTLQTIAEQIGAIREYASKQQDTVKRYRDGYDWNIIKNFCLRIIRCIDNIEKRIAEFEEQNKDPKHLSEIKDELVFTLEASGVERFEPDLHSVYRGQERMAEVVKDQADTEDDSLAGKIAKVIRSGYRYVVDEENTKIIRPALVKLFSRKTLKNQEVKND